MQAFRIERCDLILAQVSKVKIEVLHGYRRQFGPWGALLGGTDRAIANPFLTFHS